MSDNSCSHAQACPLSRREFMARGSLAVAALALLGCTNVPSLTDPLASSVTYNIADLQALATVGGIVRVDATPRTPLALARTSATTVAAYSLGCPHRGNTVSVENQPGQPAFYCAGHGAQFDIQGHNTGGQQTSSLHSYPVNFDVASGVIVVLPG